MYWDNISNNTNNPELKGISQSPFSGFLGELTTPISLPGKTSQQIQDIYNRGRGVIQGGTKLQAEQAKQYMGGQGFRGGESGIADTMLGDIFRQGAERQAGYGRDVSIHEADQEAGRKAQEAQLNLTRIMGGAQLGLQSEDQAMQNLMNYLGLMVGSQGQRWQPYWSGVSNLYAGG